MFMPIVALMRNKQRMLKCMKYMQNVLVRTSCHFHILPFFVLVYILLYLIIFYIELQPKSFTVQPAVCGLGEHCKPISFPGRVS